MFGRIEVDFMTSKKIIFTLFSFFILIFFPLIIYAEPVGKVSLLEGSVDILRKGKTTAEMAEINIPVNIGDIIRTKSNSKAEIKFIDDSIIRIAEKSRMEIKEYLFEKGGAKRKGTIGLLRGKIRSIVSKVVSQQHDYNIVTKTAVAGVRATDFFVISQPLSTQIIVKEGIVAVKNISPKIVGEVLVKMNQMTNVVQNTPPPPPVSVRAEDMKGLTEATEPAKMEKKKLEEKEKAPEKMEPSKQPGQKEPEGKKEGMPPAGKEGKPPPGMEGKPPPGMEGMPPPAGMAGMPPGMEGKPPPGMEGMPPPAGMAGMPPGKGGE